MKIAVVGAGIAGRAIACTAAARGYRVFVYDAGERSCSLVAAGQLAPFCELDTASASVHQLGVESLPIWERWASESDFYFQRAGTLVVATPGDRAELDLLERRVRRYVAGNWRVAPAACESELAGRFRDGLYFPNEGQVEAAGALRALRTRAERDGARWRSAARRLAPFAVDGERFDAVVDCRGLAARADWPALRAVRGEIARVYAPEVSLSRPVRLAHPRTTLYVVPRPQHRYVIGATALETADDGPVRVRSALELLSSAYALHPGFGEAAIESLDAQLRPALPDNEPSLLFEAGLLRVNGFYRHGYLIAPRLAEKALEILEAA